MPITSIPRPQSLMPLPSRAHRQTAVINLEQKIEAGPAAADPHGARAGSRTLHRPRARPNNTSTLQSTAASGAASGAQSRQISLDGGGVHLVLGDLVLGSPQFLS